MPPTLTDLAARVGTEVAHLTYGRLLVTQDAKPWQFVAVAEEFARIAAIFAAPLPPGELLVRRWYEQCVTPNQRLKLSARGGRCGRERSLSCLRPPQAAA